MRILIVEDDSMARGAFQEILERDGYDVTVVDNGIAGFAELQQHTYDAIICDYRLPFMDGQGFFDEVKSDDPSLASRFIFVTGYAHDPAIADQLEQTGQPVLTKPFEFKNFLSTVRSVAERGSDEPG